MEESPVEDSRSNGYVERAVQIVQDQIRTVKSALEGRMKEEVKPDHPGLPWMVINALCEPAQQVPRRYGWLYGIPTGEREGV